MEFVIRQEAKKALEQELRKARQQRQKQVRQQSVQWSEETRRKYENEKEKQIKIMTSTLTNQAEEHAKARIEHLIMINDLAVEEMGAAHRAAAQLRELEKAKELKRLQSQEMAKKRGQLAMEKTKSELQQKSQVRVEMKQRKDEIRKAEDEKSKKLVLERKPLAVSLATNQIPKAPGGPRFEQSAARKLDYPSKIAYKKPMSPSKKLANKFKTKTPSLPSIVPTGRLAKEAELRTTGAQSNVSKVEPSIKKSAKTLSPKKSQLGKAATKSNVVSVNSKSATVVYYDTRVPKPESQYISPIGLGEREIASQSPDSWKKAEMISKKSLKEIEEKAKRQEELLKKASIRGEVATKKAKLQKQLMAVTSELLESHESLTRLGTGQQTAMLGLEDISEKLEEESESDDATFQEMSSDEDVLKLSPSEETLTKFRVNKEEPDGSRVVLVEIPKTKKSISPILSRSKAVKLAAGAIQSLDDQLATLNSLHDNIQHLLRTPASIPTPSISQPPKSSVDQKTKTSAAKEEDPRDSVPKSENRFISPAVQGDRDWTGESPDPTTKVRILSTKSSTETEEKANAPEPTAYQIEPSKKKKLKHKKAKDVVTSTEKSGHDVIDSSLIRQPESNAETDRDNKKIPSVSDEKKKKKDKKVHEDEPSAKKKPVQHLDKVDTEKPKTTKQAEKTSVKKVGTKVVPPSVPKSKPDNMSEVIDLSGPSASTEATTSGEFLEMSSDGEVVEISPEEGSVVNKTKDESATSSQKENNMKSSSGSTIADIRMKTNIHPIADSTDNDSTPQKITKPKMKKKMRKEPLKVKISLEDDITNSEISQATTPAEGPFTSTPDGRLQLKQSTTTSSRMGSRPSKKDLLIDKAISKLIIRRRESIDALPVSSSSSSNLLMDSTGPSSRSPSSSEFASSFVSTTTATPSSGSTSRTWQTILEERQLVDESITEGSGIEHHKVSSSSTIGEINIKTFNTSRDDTTTTSNNGTVTSQSDTTDGSLMNKLAVLSQHQELKVLNDQLEELQRDLPDQSFQSSAGGSDPTRETSNPVEPSDDETTSMDIPDMSLVLRQIRSRHSQNPTEDSPQFNLSDKEVQRINEFIGDLSDCGDIWATPPLNGTKDHADIVSSVFEEFRDELASIPMYIERPTWSR